MATAVIVSFEGTDAVNAKTQLETLAPAAGDFVFQWRCGSKVFCAKVK